MLDCIETVITIGLFCIKKKITIEENKEEMPEEIKEILFKMECQNELNEVLQVVQRLKK